MEHVVEKVYPHAEEFLPERWYARPDLLPYKDCFAPFSVGKDSPEACIPPRGEYLLVPHANASFL